MKPESILLPAVLSLMLIPFCLHPAPVRAQTATVAGRATTTNALTPYEQVVIHLKRGRRFQAAIDILVPLCKEHPANTEYQIALGCACVARFAALAQARKQIQDYEAAVARYRERQSQWEMAQDNPDNPLYLTRPPLAPTPPVVPDDDKPLSFSDVLLAQQFKKLDQQARRAFDMAQKAAIADDKEGEVSYNQGWALLLMRRYEPVVQLVNKAVPSKAGTIVPTQEEVVTCFLACTDKNKAQAQNWQSLALAYGSSYLRVNDVTAPAKADSAKAVEALQKAVQLTPKDFDILYQAAIFSRNSAPQLSVAMLERATRRVGSNANLWYMLADQRLTSSPNNSKEAIRAVKQGSTAPQYDSINITVPAPPYLKQAWSYQKVYGLGYDFAVMGSLSTALSKIIEQNIAAGQHQEIFDGVTALFDMGIRMSQNVQLDVLDALDPTKRAEQNLRLLLGTAACHRALALAQKAQTSLPGEQLRQFIINASTTLDYLKKREARFSN